MTEALPMLLTVQGKGHTALNANALTTLRELPFTLLFLIKRRVHPSIFW